MSLKVFLKIPVINLTVRNIHSYISNLLSIRQIDYVALFNSHNIIMSMNNKGMMNRIQILSFYAWS